MLSLLFLLCLLHFVAVKHFTDGFLQMRQSFSQKSNKDSSKLAPKYERAVILVIDALRFDFVAPNPPNPPSSFYHNVLTLPRELTEKYPRNSFLYHAYADPPTTTLQRVKAIVTGSLPSFVDAGNNLDASSIADDSILKQANLAGKKIAFIGDNIWTSVFPEESEPNMTFPYDNFNVEDLETVDEGVVGHLFPLLEDPTKPFDLLIGHFIGVDHAGHRVGLSHQRMKQKLEQMNDILRRVVDLLDEHTLLVVLGDHGMDHLGNHCGDSVLETSSALWLFSKASLQAKTTPPLDFLEYETFPETTIPHRSVQQIDLVPTLSLLLGLPIPFNNLGTLIPDLFWQDDEGELLNRALEINSEQINHYLKAYRTSHIGGELDPVWDRIQTSWASTQAADVVDHSKSKLLAAHNRMVLAACRQIWAQFNYVRMGLGLGLMGVGVFATWSVWFDERSRPGSQSNFRRFRTVYAGTGGAILGVFAKFVAVRYKFHALEYVSLIPFTTLFAIFASFIDFRSTSRLTAEGSKTTIVILASHVTTLILPSLTVWEDRVVALLLQVWILPHILTGLSAQTSPIRSRILKFSFIFTVCIQLMSISTVCREEQQPYCRVTFFGNSTAPPILAVLLSIPMTVALPLIISRFLRASDLAPLPAKSLSMILSPSLVGGTGYWILEWADSANLLGDEWFPTLRLGRTWLARVAFCITLFGGSMWWIFPMYDVKTSISSGMRKPVEPSSNNNSGTSYLLFFTITFSMAYITAQLAGQLILCFALFALLSYLELLHNISQLEEFIEMPAKMTDASPDSSGITFTSSHSRRVKFADIIPLPLLGILAFYGTGHQATIASLQLKSAFLLHPTVARPYSRITLALNSFGPFFAIALAAPLIILWKRKSSAQKRPDPSGASNVVLENMTRVGLGVMLYHSVLLLASAVGTTALRRHPLVWKVLAPRYVLSAAVVTIVDVAILIGIGAGRRVILASRSYGPTNI